MLIIQDLAAVLYLALFEAKTASVWAPILLMMLIPGRYLAGRILSSIGHGELQVFFGLIMAIGGAGLFETVDLKGDPDALLFGVLLANHCKSKELARALLDGH